MTTGIRTEPGCAGHRRVGAGIAAFCFAAQLAFSVHTADAAEAWPAKPVRVIVPFAPGGYVDLGTRLVAGPLSTALGQQVVVENRGGAGGVVGSELAARAAPDGYTLVVGSVGTHAVNQSLYAKLPYNVLRDFVAVARLSDSPNVLAVHPSLPVRNVTELIAMARARPGQLTYASAGAGTSTHLAAALFEMLAKVQFVQVAYKGGGPALIDVVAGQVPVTFGTAASVTPHSKTGRVRAIAVTGSERSQLLPELPTIAEGGLTGYDANNWYGLMVPAKTPRAIIDRLNRETVKVLNMPEIKTFFFGQGLDAAPGTPEAFGAYIKSERIKWAKVVKASGAKAE